MNWLEEIVKGKSKRDSELLERASAVLEDNIFSGEKYPWFPLRGIVPSPYKYMGMWNWDFAFHAMAVKYWSPELAYEQCKAFIDIQVDSGMFPDVWYTDGGRVEDFTKPPVFPWAFVGVYKESPNRYCLEQAYIAYKKNEQFWCSKRKVNGLFHYDCEVEPAIEHYAKCESGWDTSLRFDGSAIKLCAIDLNCYMIMMYRALQYMAQELGFVDDLNCWKQKENELENNINEKMWDAGKTYSKARRDLVKQVEAVTKVATIPAVKEQKELLDKILNTDYLNNAVINEFEHIRENLRDIIKFIPVDNKLIYETDFTDKILSREWRDSELENDDLKNYKAKVNYYIREHQNDEVIAKLHTNKPLNKEDIKSLEKILWSELGTKDDYKREYGDKPLGLLVRKIVGMDMNAAKEAFSKYLNDVNLDDRQIYFVNQIINYIVVNGAIIDLSVLQEAPFNNKGDVAEVFKDTVVWMDIMKVIKSINANAAA